MAVCRHGPILKSKAKKKGVLQKSGSPDRCKIPFLV